MKRRWLALGFGLAGVPCLGAACSLAVSTDGLSGGAPPADAARPDVSVLPDAPVEAAVDAGDGCEASFCDDFDHGPLGQKWTRRADGDAGVLSLSTLSPVSPPQALSAVLRATPSNATRYEVMLEKDLGAVKSLRCTFSMNVITRPTTSLADVFRIRTSATGVVDFVIQLGLSASDGTFRDDIFFPDGGCACPRHDPPFPTFPVGRWVLVEVATDFTRATAKFDGTVVADTPVGPITPASPVLVAIGGYSSRGSTLQAEFDDFACDVTR